MVTNRVQYHAQERAQTFANADVEIRQSGRECPTEDPDEWMSMFDGFPASRNLPPSSSEYNGHPYTTDYRMTASVMHSWLIARLIFTDLPLFLHQCLVLVLFGKEVDSPSAFIA